MTEKGVRVEGRSAVLNALTMNVHQALLATSEDNWARRLWKGT